MGPARRTAAALLLVLSLWQLIVWGFWGLLAVVFSRGIYGTSEASSTGRQVVLGLALLLLAAVNPITASALFLRGTLLTWLLTVGILVIDVITSVFFFADNPLPQWFVILPIVATVLLVLAFPRRAPA